jgi:hypothetical protein
MKLRAELRASLASGGSRGWRPGESAAAAPRSPVLSDERTVAQLRALSYLLTHLETAAADRDAIQLRRRRSDREIFERFPLYLVPTYPGDRALFESPGFAAWLPPDLPLARHKLEELMELDPPEPSKTGGMRTAG